MTSQEAPADLLPLPRLFSQSWSLFKSRWTVVITIAALGAAASLAAIVIPFACTVPFWGHLPSAVLLIAAASVALIATLWLSSWAPVAMIEAMLDDSARPPEVWELIKKSRGKIVPFSWAYILFFLLVFSGFCLFIVPGIYLSVSLSLAFFVCVAEPFSGMAALEKSLHYVHGRWWQTLWRLIAIGFVGFAPDIVPVIGWIAGALLSPLPLAMAAILFKDLRKTREAQGPLFVPSKKTRLLIASSLLGLVLPLLGAAAVYKIIGSSSADYETQWLSMARQGQSSYFAKQWFAALQELEKPR